MKLPEGMAAIAEERREEGTGGGGETGGGEQKGGRNLKLLRRWTATKLPVYVTRPGLWKTVRLEFCLTKTMSTAPTTDEIQVVAPVLLFLKCSHLQ